MTSPKIYILPFDSSGNSDPTVTKQLLDFLPNKVGSENEADVVLTVCSYMANYKFNPVLLEVRKPLVILDFTEMGWDWPDGQDNLLGRGNLAKCSFLNTPEYAKLDEFIKEHPPALTFKRELYKTQVSPTVIPISWLCYLPSRPTQDREKYNARPIEVFNCFGLSHPSRFRLHGDIFRNAHNAGISVADAWSFEQKLEKRAWVSIYSPYHSRVAIETITRWQRRAKISVSMHGAGQRCFRDCEAPLDCIMAHPIDSMAWPFDWTTENSIQLMPGAEFDDLLYATQRTDLHEVYLASQENLDKYRSQRFVDDYFMKHLLEVL